MNLEFENLLIFCLFLYSRYAKSLVSLVIRKIGKVSIGGEKKKKRVLNYNGNMQTSNRKYSFAHLEFVDENC